MAFRLTGPRGRVYLIATAVIVVMLALFLWAPDFLQAVEVRLYDLHFKLRGTQPQRAERIVIAAIDEKSLAALGRWPWPRSLMADLIRKLSADGAKIIAVDILLSEPEVSGELRAATQLSERLRTLGLAGSSAGSAVQRELDAFAREADRDRQLAEAVRDSGRVILPIVFEVGPDRSGPAPEPSGVAFKSALVTFRHYDERGVYPPPAARSATPPIPVLADAAKTLGHVTMLADRDGTTRWEAVAFEHQGHYYPSLAVQAVSLATEVEPTKLTLDFGRALAVGSVSVPLDPRDRMLINYAGPGGTFRHLSAVDLLTDKIPPDAVRDRIVFVGATAAGTYDLRVTPTSPIMPGVEKHANVAGNILSGRFLRRPDWVELVDLAGILLFPFLLAGLLPRLRPAVSVGAVALVWAVMFASVHLAFRGGLWLPRGVSDSCPGAHLPRDHGVPPAHRGATAPVDEASVPAVRQSGSRRAAHGQSRRAPVRRRDAEPHRALLGYPGLHAVHGAPPPAGSGPDAAGVSDENGGPGPGPAGHARQVHRRRRHGDLRGAGAAARSRRAGVPGRARDEPGAGGAPGPVGGRGPGAVPGSASGSTRET